VIRFSYSISVHLSFALLLTSMISVAGCGDDSPPRGDSGSGDSTVGDSSSGDSSTPDDSSTPADSGVPTDTGTPMDSGMTTDSGAVDSGFDSAIPDGGRDDGAPCMASAECASTICIAGRCRAISCTDGVLNGEETQVDCGGTVCRGCAPGGACVVPGDCLSGLCTDSTCDAPDCTDSVINQDETDTDCGGTICSACTAGEMCVADSDCDEEACDTGVCVSCSDGVANGIETDIDCGGMTCTDRCTTGEMCGVPSDCESGSCGGGVCLAPTCSDGVKNGTETAIDCGGPTGDGCPRCPDFSTCTAGRDCVDGNCISGYCGTNPCVPFTNPSDTGAVFGYVGCSYTPTALPCPDIRATGMATGVGDDDFLAVPVGFSFDFYGTAHTMVNVESNGGVSFDSGDMASFNSCLPSTSGFASSVFVAGLWDDLDPDEAGSAVYYQTLGTAPNQQFVAQWDTERFFAGTDRGVFTIVLNEGSDDIDVCYVDTDFGDASYDAGESATAGLQGAVTDYVEFSCNMPALTDGLLVRYIHP